MTTYTNVVVFKGMTEKQSGDSVYAYIKFKNMKSL